MSFVTVSSPVMAFTRLDNGYSATLAGAPFFSPVQTATAGSAFGLSGLEEVDSSGMDAG